MSETSYRRPSNPATMDDVLREPQSWRIVGWDNGYVIYAHKNGFVVVVPPAPTSGA